MTNEEYILSLLPTVKGLLLAKGKSDVVELLKDENVHVNFYNHDNWNGGIDFYNIVIYISPNKFNDLSSKEDLEKEIADCFGVSLGDTESIIVGGVVFTPSNKVDNSNDYFASQSSNIWFEVVCLGMIRKRGNICSDLGNLKQPQHTPCYILDYDDGWNDFFTYKTSFSMYYYRSPQDVELVGCLKIMNDDEVETYKVIPKGFQHLTDDYCSLGCTTDFYSNLKMLVGHDECVKVLHSLSDCSINPLLAKKYRQTDEFKKSLIRGISSERALREAVFVINDIPKEKSYDFYYVCNSYDKQVSWNASFLNNSSYGRCLGLIGENGVGKTSLLKHFIEDLMCGKNECFRRKPMYSEIILLSTSSYDEYVDIKKCGTQNLPLEVAAIQNSDVIHIEKSINNIILYSRKESFWGLTNEMFSNTRTQCKQFLGNLYSLLKEDSKNKVDGELVKNILNSMSSGERQIFSLIVYLCEKIWYDTLIVIDEPEIHLHPQAIMNFMGLLSKVLVKYESYAIIATHSPLVVREMIGRNVFMMNKYEGDVRMVQSIDVECFGENIAFLYKKIFGYDETQSNLYKTVEQYVDEGMTFDEVVDKLETNENLPLSLNCRMIIQKVLLKNENKS